MRTFAIVAIPAGIAAALGAALGWAAANQGRKEASARADAERVRALEAEAARDRYSRALDELQEEHEEALEAWARDRRFARRETRRDRDVEFDDDESGIIEFPMRAR